jgi:hypothetical protein
MGKSFVKLFWLFNKTSFFRGIPFRSELRIGLFQDTRNHTELALYSAEQRKPFRVFSAQFFPNEISMATVPVYANISVNLRARRNHSWTLLLE